MIYLNTFKDIAFKSIHCDSISCNQYNFQWSIQCVITHKKELYKDQTSDNTSKVIYLHTFKDSAFDSSPLHVHVTALTFTRPACHPVLDSTEKHGNMGM